MKIASIQEQMQALLMGPSPALSSFPKVTAWNPGIASIFFFFFEMC